MLKKMLKMGYWFHSHGVKKIPGFVNVVIRLVYGCDIPCTMKIPDSVYFAHNGLGCVINGSSIIKENVTIYPNVIIGKHKNACPTIEENVFVGAGAIIIGGVVIGHGAQIGAGSIVMKDVAPNTLITGQLATERKIYD